MRYFLLFGLLFSIMACSTNIESLPTGVLSDGDADNQNRQAAINASFNANDLSGCWKFVSVFPHSGDTNRPPFVLKKLRDNYYQAKEQVNEDSIHETFIINGKHFEYRYGENATQKGEVRFDQPPYQLVLTPEASPDAFEAPQQDGFEWLGTTCPS